MHKIGGAFISNWPKQKIGCATIGCILAKLPKVGGAIAPPVPPPLSLSSLSLEQKCMDVIAAL